MASSAERRFQLTRLSLTLMTLTSLALVAVGGTTTRPLAKGSWINLFNGRNLDGWKPKFTGHALNENYKNTFRVENGLLKVSYDEYDRFNGEFGHLFYKDKFSDYRIRVEYRFVGKQAAGGPDWAFLNSGVMIHSQSPESMSRDQKFPVSIEAQILGDDGSGKRTTGNVCTPGTLIEVGGKLITEHCFVTSTKAFPANQWVTMEVEVHGNSRIRHIVNGEVVSEYEKPQLDESDPEARPLIVGGQRMLSEGYIALQAETHPIEFRKVLLMTLPPSPP
jgi:3-keto-disaccharide hydrolase